MSGFNFKISGAAGEGIKVAGLIFSRACLQTGLFVHGYTEYPSLIRGGLNTFQVLADTDPVFCAQTKFDLEISLSDPVLKAPKNIYALGIACAKLGIKLEILNRVIKTTFAKKSPEIINANLEAAQAGFKSCHSPKQPLELPSLTNQELINGNEAVALGAVSGGLQFFSAYPMTPVTGILHFLADKAKKYHLKIHHAEDEIGVINMAIGASYAGTRSMVATSGGGFCLMTEGLGLSGVSQTPLVVVLGMRPGPSTGMPTWSGQGDLLFAINASQDEFPRIVLTPGDPQEAFTLTAKALDLAEKYRLPVIVLTDKNLGESYYTVPKFNLNVQVKRYPHPLGLANSYEHDDDGFSTENSQMRIKQVNRRLEKTAKILASKEVLEPILYGPKTAPTTILSWGSNKGVILEALKKLPQTNFIHFPWVWPFPKTAFLDLIKSQQKLICLEANSQAQLAKLISQETGIIIKDKLLKYDGRPFYPEEIIAYVKNH